MKEATPPIPRQRSDEGSHPSLFGPLLLPFLILFFAGACVPEATEADMKRVQETFLLYRFRNSAAMDEYKTDRELMELSCKENKVSCRDVLRLLGEKDPQFYRTFIERTGKDESFRRVRELSQDEQDSDKKSEDAR